MKTLENVVRDLNKNFLFTRIFSKLVVRFFPTILLNFEH